MRDPPRALEGLDFGPRMLSHRLSPTPFVGLDRSSHYQTLMLFFNSLRIVPLHASQLEFLQLDVRLSRR